MADRNGKLREEALRKAVHAAAGRPVRTLDRFVRGAQSVNYAGIWDDDGSRFALKLVPFARERQYRRLVDHLESVRPGLVVREPLPRCRFDFAGHHALLMEWCAGEIRTFGELCAEGAVEELVADYRAFSETIQGVQELYPTYDYRKLAETMRQSPLASALPPGQESVDFSALTDAGVVIHGDFQYDNLRFTDGRLSGVLDIEEFRRGSPLEDFARYVCQSVDRMPWWTWRRWRAVLSGVERLRQATGASPEAWRAAVWGQALWKARKMHRKGNVSARQVLNLKWRLRKYVDLMGGRG